MEETITITQARHRFLGLPDELAKDKTKAIAVTRRGSPVMAIVPWDLYESIVETLEILGDPELMAHLRKSIKEAEAGKTIPWEKVKRDLSL